jgi:uncharacterized protein YciI
MPLFVISFLDNPGAGPARAASRDAHLAYMRGSGVMKLGGPYLDDEGQAIGSLIIIEADDLAAAKAFSDKDPYSIAGVFSKAEIRPWKHTAGQIP